MKIQREKLKKEKSKRENRKKKILTEAKSDFRLFIILRNSIYRMKVKLFNACCGHDWIEK